jgi:sortase A
VARRKYARSIEDLSVEELRHLLIEKQRAERERRLDNFRRTGRVVKVEPRPGYTPLNTLRTDPEYKDSYSDTGPRPRSKRRTWLDRMLFIVEAAAVLGLMFVVFNGLNIMRDLNQEVAAVLEQPTLTPTPLIMAVVLPSGHTPPKAGEQSRPNDAEIPAHLAPLVQSLADIPVPTPGPQQAVRLQIPAIGVDHPVVQGDGWEQLKKGIGQHIGSPNPGEQGNLVLSAHNDVFGEIFRDLDKLKPGDEIIVFTSQRTFTYSVQQSQIVEPTQVEVMAPSQEPVVTLISCYPYLVDDKRYVITAYLQDPS